MIRLSALGVDPIDALARFGDLSVEALLRTILDPTVSSGEKTGPTFALAEMLRGAVPNAIRGVSEPNRNAIVDAAADCLEKHLTFSNVIEVTSLALATKRPDLRRELETLATDSSAWTRRGLADADLIKWGQSAIQGKLAIPVTR